VEPEPEPELAPELDADAEPALGSGDERRSSSLRLLRHTPDPDERVDLAEDFEGVRIIRPEPEPDEQLQAEPDAPAADITREPEPVTAPQPIALVPEPEPDGGPPVDDLFARLRADRADKVARAESVLASTEAPEAPEPVPAPPDAETPDLEVLATRDQALADAERGLVKSLKRALADEQNEVLDALRRLKGAPTIVALLPDPAVHDARYDAVLSGAAGEAAATGGKVAGGSAGGPGSVPADFGRSVAGDLRLRVGRAIDESSGDVETLADAISSSYREWKTARVEPLASDAIAASFAAGIYAAADGHIRWVVDPAEGGCPDCDDNALAGAIPKGALFPTGQLHPPAHTGCRCAVVDAPSESAS
jgi:hypothetical protein